MSFATRSRRSWPIRMGLLLAAVSPVLQSCGGADVFDRTASESLEFTASSAEINYGDTVSVSWLGRNLVADQPIRDSNFIADTAALASTGSFTDRPATNAEYTLVVRRPLGTSYRDIRAYVTVKVRPGTKRYLIVGDPAANDVVVVQKWLKLATSATTTVLANLPADAAGYDAVVLTDSAATRPVDAPRIQPWLTANKGVIVVGRAANLLATGDLTKQDVTSISTWFGGSTVCKTVERFYTAVTKTPLGIPFSSTFQIRNLAISGKTFGTKPIAAATTLVGAEGWAGAWTYPVAGSGRVFYIGTTISNSPSNAIQTSDVFVAGSRWAAGG